MPHRAPLAKRRTARKLLFAALCLAAATTWNGFRPATVHAEEEWCADECESTCASVGSSCAGVWWEESGCYWWCA